MDSRQILIGKKLARARTDLGMTQLKLAELVGVTTVTISNYERGIRSLSTDIVKRMCHFLGIDLDSLLDNDSLELKEKAEFRRLMEGLLNVAGESSIDSFNKNYHLVSRDNLVLFPRAAVNELVDAFAAEAGSSSEAFIAMLSMLENYRHFKGSERFEIF